MQSLKTILRFYLTHHQLATHTLHSKLVRTLAIGLLLMLFMAAPTQADLNAGLVALWQLDGDAHDASGNNHNGTLFGTTPTTDRFGNAGHALLFDGISDHISVPASSLLSPATLTISAWIMTSDIPNTLNTAFIITSDPDGTFNCAHGYEMFIKKQADASLQPIVNADPPQCGLCCWVFSDSPIDGTWHHIAFTYDGILRMYIDGILQSTNTSPNYAPTNGPVTIGADPFNGGSSVQAFYFGALDEIRIYNRALSQTEILRLFNINDSFFSVSTSDPALAFPVSGVLSAQLATLNVGPPPFDPTTWLPVNRRSHANPPPQSPFRCDCTGVPPALGCDAILRADPLAEVFVAPDQHLTSVDEVTLDNCGSAFYRFTFAMPPGFLNPVLSGSANVDDEAVLFLNGNRISAALTNPGCDPDPVNGAGDPCYGMQDVGMDRVDGQGLPVLTWPTLDSFQTTDPTFFVPGENELVFAVAGDASFFEPTGLEFTASINFDCAGATFATTGDIAGFIGVLLDGPFTVNELCLADMNRDGVVDGADIQPFVNAILGP